ncbi:hypothetical protein D3C85_1034110 [compost metagenome]
MGEVPAADRCRGKHGVVFGQGHLACAIGIEQLEQGAFLGVVRAGGVAGGRADALVLLPDQILVAQLFVRLVAPPGLAHLLVQPFGAGFGQTVGQGLDHDRVVVVAGVLIGLGHFLGADAGSGDKAADIIGDAAVLGGDEVGQGEIRLAVGLDGLLA